MASDEAHDESGAFQLGRMQQADPHWFSCSWRCFSEICRPCVKKFSPGNDAQFNASIWSVPSVGARNVQYTVTSKGALSCRCCVWGMKIIILLSLLSFNSNRGRELRSMKWMLTNVSFEAFFAYFSETFGFDPQTNWTRACSAFPGITVTLDPQILAIPAPSTLFMWNSWRMLSGGTTDLAHGWQKDEQRGGPFV